MQTMSSSPLPPSVPVRKHLDITILGIFSCGRNTRLIYLATFVERCSFLFIQSPVRGDAVLTKSNLLASINRRLPEFPQLDSISQAPMQWELCTNDYCRFPKLVNGDHGSCESWPGMIWCQCFWPRRENGLCVTQTCMAIHHLRGRPF